MLDNETKYIRGNVYVTKAVISILRDNGVELVESFYSKGSFDGFDCPTNLYNELYYQRGNVANRGVLMTLDEKSARSEKCC